MRIETVSLEKITEKSLYFGYTGEKDHTMIVIRCASLFKDYPDAVAAISVRPPVGDTYPVSPTKSGTDLIWEISQGDIAYAGAGTFQLTFTDDGEIIKSEFGKYTVNQSLTATGTVPDPVEDWLEAAEAALAEIESSVVEVSGSTPSITGENGKWYKCGTLTSLTLTAPEEGLMYVVFTSGSTATTMTATGVTWPGWFSAPEANTVYEISILDGKAVVSAWATT